MKTKNEKNSNFYFILKQKSNVPFDPRIQSVNFDINAKIRLDNYKEKGNSKITFEF